MADVCVVQASRGVQADEDEAAGASQDRAVLSDQELLGLLEPPELNKLLTERASAGVPIPRLLMLLQFNTGMRELWQRLLWSRALNIHIADC